MKKFIKRYITDSDLNQFLSEQGIAVLEDDNEEEPGFTLDDLKQVRKHTKEAIEELENTPDLLLRQENAKEIHARKSWLKGVRELIEIMEDNNIDYILMTNP